MCSTPLSETNCPWASACACLLLAQAQERLVAHDALIATASVTATRCVARVAPSLSVVLALLLATAEIGLVTSGHCEKWPIAAYESICVAVHILF